MKDPNFYITVAQIIPLLMLALVWDGGYLTRVSSGETLSQSVWTPSRVKIWSWLILPYAAAVELLCILATDARSLRNELWGTLVVIALIGLLTTLLVRMLADVSLAAGAAAKLALAQGESR
jgi:hypothetical protein